MPNQAPTANEQIADQITTHSVNMLRVEASLRNKVFAELKALQSEITSMIAALPEEATAFKRARLNALLEQTNKSINATYDLIAQASGKSLSKIAGLEQAKTNQILNNTFAVEVATVAQTPKQLEQMVNGQLVDGKFQKEWWDAQSKDLQDQFQRAMRTGVSKGEGIDALVRRVIGTKAANYTDGIMLLPRYQAQALVRTSVQSTANQARINSFLANLDVIKGIQWRSTLDSRTTKICVALDGKQWALPSFEPVGHDIEFPGPTAHWNCRSTQTAVTKSFDELSKKGGVKPPGRPAQPLDDLLRERLAEKGVSAKQIEAAVEEKRLAFDGEAAAPVSFDEFLKGKSNEFQDQLLGKQRAQLWREGKIHLTDLIDQSSRPLSIDELHGMIAKNQALSTKTYKEGEGGLPLVDRKLLEESMVQGVQQKSELTHFLNLETGERITINGRSPSTADLNVVAKWPKLGVLRNSLTPNDQLFSPQEMQLFGSLPNFVSARVVSPAGRVLSLTVKKSGPGFDSNAASAANIKVADLATQKAPRDAFMAGVRGQGSLRVSLSPAGTVQPATAVFNQSFGSLSLARPLTTPPEELLPGQPKSTFEVVAATPEKSPSAFAKALFENARLAAPRHDAAMQALAAQSGGENTGLQYSVKTEESLLEKITQDVLEKRGYTPEIAAGRVGDSVRYTITYDPKHYAEGARQVLGDLEASGYDLIRWKNMWDRPDYHGINAVLRDKASGLFVELQLHTPESWDTKQNKTHDVYERMKLAKQTGDKAAYKQAEKENAAFWAKVPVPEGARFVTIADPPARITTENISQYRGGLNTFALAEQIDQAANAFVSNPDAHWVDLSTLISPKNELADRAYLAGLKDDPRSNAMLGMLDAIKVPGAYKRDPLDVRDNGDGTYTVLDGNATSQAAMLAGWKKIPVIIHDQSGAILKAPPLKPPPPPDQLAGIPDSIKDLVRESSLGGTTGAALYRDPLTGARYVLKHGASPEHVQSEFLANELYRALNVPVPASRLIQTEQGPAQLARFVEGARDLKDYMANATAGERNKITKVIQNDFAVDALLSNIDVLGTNMDNVLIDAKGKAWRIDNGGALAFRAQGEPKTFWNQGALELWSMRADKYVPAGIHPLPANLQIFGPLSIENVAQQIMQLPQPKLTGLPPDLASVLFKRFENAKVIARGALDAIRDKMAMAYTDDLSFGRMQLREKAIHEAMPGKLTPRAEYGYRYQLKDASGKLYDDLNDGGTFGTYQKEKAPEVPYKPEIAQAILDGVKAFNYHLDTGKPVNQAKIDKAVAFLPELEADIQVKATTQAQVYDTIASSYMLTHLKILKFNAEEKYTNKLVIFTPPKVPGPEPAPSGQPMNQRFGQFLIDKGFKPDVLAGWMNDHASETWDYRALAYKWFLSRQFPREIQNLGFWKESEGKAASYFSTWAKDAGGEENLRQMLTLYHALTQEALDTVGLPLIDRERRLVRVLRTENENVWKGVHAGRGFNESGSLTNVYALNHYHLSLQAVPFSRVTALWFNGRPSEGTASTSTDGGAFASTHENEVSFIAAGQPFTKGPANYQDWVEEDKKKDPQLRDSTNAADWGIDLDWFERAIINEALRTPLGGG